MAGTTVGYQTHSIMTMHPELCKVKKSLNFGDDSGIESEFEAGAGDADANTLIFNSSQLEEESGQSGRKRRMCVETELAPTIHETRFGQSSAKKQKVNQSGSEHDLRFRQVQLGLRTDSSLGMNRSSYGLETSQSAMFKNLQDNGQQTRRCLRDIEVCRLQTGLGLTECMLPASRNLAEISGLSTGLNDVLTNFEAISDSYW